MTKSSSSNWPFQSRTLSRPMCIGRSMKVEPRVSARFFSAGPRSTVTPVTTATASATAAVATTRRTMTRVRCVSGCENTAGSDFSVTFYSITTSTVCASTEAPSATRTSRTVPARGARSSFSIFMASTTTTP
jgi:hypothetical protein